MKNYTLKQTLLYLDKVTLGYDDKVILKDISLVEKDVVIEGETTGQSIAIIGRSGRGKSTLFKSLTGLLKPLSGQILINNMSSEVTDDAKIISEGDVGFVNQKYTLFRHKTIQQICEFALRKTTLNKIDKQLLIIKTLTEWGLLEHKDKYSVELSGGQAQRCAIVEQLLCSKHFMVFDEPTSGLDPYNVNLLKNSFKQIMNSDDLNTIIFSTHSIEFAVEMADSIYVLGFPENTQDYSTIIKHYDLKEMELAWQEYGTKHLDLVKEIKDLLIRS